MKKQYGAAWVLVFLHDSSTGLYYSNTEVLSTSSQYKYSILNYLEDFKYQGVWEFLLEYPELQGYNRWNQSSNPTKSTSVTDYNPIHITWDINDWNGLALSSTSNTFIDGSPTSNSFFYSIGLYRQWRESIPGPYNITDDEYEAIHKVLLWARISLNDIISSSLFSLLRVYSGKILFFCVINIFRQKTYH